MTVWLVLLTLGAYLLGGLPVHHWVARRHKGVDLHQYGTGHVGTGNLWRMTSSWKIGLAVGIFDFTKGMVMVLLARFIGLDTGLQLVVGLAAIIGHNWSVWLRFAGGRGVATALGVMLITPLVNGMPPWTIVAFVAAAVVPFALLRTTPLPVLVGLAAVPLASWWLYEPPALAGGFLAMLLIIVAKRLMVPRSAEAASISKRRLFYNRLLFDRDIQDRKVWMYRRPAAPAEVEEG